MKYQWNIFAAYYVLRSLVPPGQLIGLVRSSVQALDQDLPVYGVKASTST